MYNLVKSLAKSQRIFKLLNGMQSYSVLFRSNFYDSKPKVLITRAGLPGKGIEKLKEECEVDVYERDNPMPKDEIIRRIPGADGLYCLITEKIDKDVLDAAGDQLKVISTLSAGYDHIDLQECKKKGILVSNTSNLNANSVAEWTVLLMLCTGRRFLEAATAVKKGEWTTQWRPSWLIGKGLENSVVGIVGMGMIGQCVMRRIFPFGVKRVLYNDVCRVQPAEEMGAIYSEFRELVKESDFVVSTCNLTDTSRNLFNKSVFNLMKPNAVFVNTSRGEVVNQEDLYDALKHKIRAAAIDVMVPEPLPPYHKLNALPNIIITPHLASSEKDVIIKMSNLAAENVLLGVKGKPLATPVSMPD